MADAIDFLPTIPRDAGDVPKRSTTSGDETASSSRPSIEQRFEVETTLAGLGLEDGDGGLPIGLNDRYVLRELVGRGAMGAVFLAEDVELQRNVAIKVVARGIRLEQQTLRLRREARALAALDHRNVIKVFDLGVDGEEVFIAMEHVDGQTLRAWQKGRSVDEVLDAYLQAGRGLAAAHARGLVHRDFKPDNVLVDEERHSGLRVRVGDFGLVGGDVEANVPTEPAGGRGPLTSNNALMGTVSYMAPEQLRREPADDRSDQHQFCVSLWEAIAGERPFGPSGRPLEGTTAVPACPRTMPSWVYRVLRRGLAFAPNDRYPGMEQLLLALEGGRRRQRARTWAAVVGSAAGVAALAWWLQPEPPTPPDPCQGTGERMAAAWAPPTRERVEAMFEGAGEEQVGEYVLDRLDRATARWSEENHQLCEAREQATLGARELDARQSCLEQWAIQIEQRIGRLPKLTGAEASAAFELVTALESVGESCTIPPLPIEPSVVKAIERAEQAELLRNLDDALRFASEAVDVARAQGRACEGVDPDEPPRSTELAAALFRLGHVQAERGEPKQALATLTDAYVNAHVCGDDHRAAEARIHAAKVYATPLGAIDDARRSLTVARVALRGVEEPAISLRRYDERLAAGLVASHAGEFEAALSYVEQAFEALEQPPDPILKAKLEFNRGVTLDRMGRYSEAARAYGRASTLVGEALGREHALTRFYTARQALNLGLTAFESDDFTTMERRFEQVASLGEPVLVVKALTTKARAAFEREDEDSTRASMNALLAFLGTQPSLDPVTRATAETTAGQLLVAVGDARGIDVLERACAQWRALDKPEQAAPCELSLAQALHEANRTPEARFVLDRVRRLAVDPSGPIPAALEEMAQYLSTAPEVSSSSPDSP